MIDRQRNGLNETNSPTNKGIICPLTAKLRCNLQSASKHTACFLLIIILWSCILTYKWEMKALTYGTLWQCTCSIETNNSHFSFYEPLPRVTYINTLLLGGVVAYSFNINKNLFAIRYGSNMIWFLVICKRITPES